MATKTSKYHTAESEAFPIFLTDYDPSYLPGGSLDPLGFERGYLLLADKILPGLTNVADKPRYFSVLCAGAFLAVIDANSPPRVQYQSRLDCILRIERFWALANVLAIQSSDNGDEFSDSGIRGVTYSRNAAESLLRVGSARTDTDFKLLSRQVPYGVVAPCTGLEPATCWLTAYQNHDDFIGFCCLGKDFSGAIGPKIDGISRIAV